MGEGLGATFDALIPTALPKFGKEQREEVRDSIRRRYEDDSRRTPSPKTPAESPKLDRKGSVLKRLGKSLKRTVRKRLESLGAVRDRSSASSPARSVDSDHQNQVRTASPLTMRKYAATGSERLTSPERRAVRGSKRVLETQDSDAADSGVILKLSSFEKGISFDSSGHSRSEFDTDSSKHSSAKSKPGNSLRRTAEAPTTKYIPESVTVQLEHSVVGREERDLIEEGQDDLEFRDLFQQQGLEAVELSESTLV